MSTKKKLQCGYRRPRKKAREIFDFLLTIGCNPVTIRFVRCECSSSGRAPPCQGGGSEFEPRHSLHFKKHPGQPVLAGMFFANSLPPPVRAPRAREIRGAGSPRIPFAGCDSEFEPRHSLLVGAKSAPFKAPPFVRSLSLCPLAPPLPSKTEGRFRGGPISQTQRGYTLLTGYFNTKTGRALRPAGFSFLFRTAHIILTVKNTAWTNIQPTSANIRYWHKEMPKISPSTMATAVTAQVRKVIR